MSIYRSATKYSQVPFCIEMKVPEGEYLSFVELGEVVSELSYVEGECMQRELQKLVIEPGKVNLIAIDTGR